MLHLSKLILYSSLTFSIPSGILIFVLSINGKFFPFISKNFKVLKLHKIYGPTEGGEFYFIQLISSKMDKKYYIAGYRGRDSINDSYCIIKNFKNKKKAYDFFETFRIKKEDQFERLYW